MNEQIERTAEDQERFSRDMKRIATTQRRLSLPVTTERNGILGKLFLHDAHGNWIADLSSKYADEVAATLNDSPRLLRENEALREALRKISKWHGEFPATNKAWNDGTEMSFFGAFGSDGERDFMRQVASDALAQIEGGVK